MPVSARRLGRNLTAGLLLAAVVVTPATAQLVPPGMGMTPSMGAMGGPTAEPVVLTDPLVVQFIETFPPILDGARTISGAAPTASPGDVFGALSASTQTLGQLNALVTPHGYTDFGQWTGIFISVSTAIAFAAMDTQTRAMMAQMAAAGMVPAGSLPPQGNIDAVTPHLEALEVLFE